MHDTLSIRSSLLRLLSPVRVLPIVDDDIRTELLQHLLLLFCRCRGNDLCASCFGELDCEQRDTSGSLGQDPVSRHQLLQTIKRVPGCETGAGEGCAFDIVQVGWQLDEALLWEDTVAAEGSVEDTAESGADCL